MNIKQAIQQAEGLLATGDAHPDAAVAYFKLGCSAVESVEHIPQYESFEAAVRRAHHDGRASRWRAALEVGLNELRHGAKNQRL